MKKKPDTPQAQSAPKLSHKLIHPRCWQKPGVCFDKQNQSRKKNTHTHTPHHDTFIGIGDWCVEKIHETKSTQKGVYRKMGMYFDTESTEWQCSGMLHVKERAACRACGIGLELIQTTAKHLIQSTYSLSAPSRE